MTLPAEEHDLVKSEKKEAGCTADGHEEYWQCSKCHRFFSDEEGNTRISEPKVISKTGHSLKKMERKEASCTESGYEAYWKCQNEICQKLFSDEGGKTGINQPKEIKATGHKYEEPAYIWSADNLKCTAERKCTACDDVEMETADATATVVQEKNCILPELTMFHVTFKNGVFEGQTKENVKTAEATGHDLEKVEKKVASCTESGHEGYWKCQTCEKLFSDEAGKIEISQPVEIEALGHALEKVEKKEASCTESGYEAYWKCQTCAKLFSDEAGKTEINESVEIPAVGHSLEKIEKKEADCTESGHEGYWKCQTCEKLFSDETGKTEISESVEIPALGHSLEKIEKKEVGCTESGYEAYWKCQICEKLFSDEAGTDEIVSLDDIQIPAKGHEEGNEWLSDAEKHWKECAVCQEKTEEADHVYVNETDTVCEICGYERTIKSEVPEILEGHNGKWQMNSGKTLSFRSSAPFAEFISVTIDDMVVDEKNYDKAEGSTIIILHPEFLSTLSVGTHTLSIDSASGSASTEFTIEEATAEPSITETPSVTPTTAPSATTASTAATVTPAPTASPAPTTSTETKAPKTGDESNVAIWMLLLFLSAEGIIVALQKSKKKTR